MPKRDSLKFPKTGPTINYNIVNNLSTDLEDTISPMNDMLLINRNSEEYSEEYNNNLIEYPKETNYVGNKEDEQWLQTIDVSVSFKEMYSKMLQFCGIFRWQNAHGFKSRHFQGISHIQPIFDNLKQEALRNDYCVITIQDWNQLLRKAHSLSRSPLCKQWVSLYNGKFEDQITKHSISWGRNEQIEMKEIVHVKLYTDFDRLQFELKKCFRWEYIQEFVEKNSFTSNTQDDCKDDILDGNNDRMNRDSREKSQLLNRLQQFYHWRQSLAVIFNKYGHKLNHSSSRLKILYHGVNTKLILNPSITTAFYGPLSTTESFYVAKTFATDKGFVLTLSSQYPRLGVCKAFNASLVSDYPEEQEWIIGFVYFRIRQIHSGNIFEWQRLPPASNLRFVFFALHLFKQQIFSMSDDLEEILIEIFLEKDSKTNKKYNKIYNNDQSSTLYRKAKKK
eukprot:296060_1